MAGTTRVTREDVVRVARTYIGTPYLHQGRRAGKGAGAGLDCGGILVLVAKELELYMPDVAVYTRYADGIQLRAVIEARTVRVDVALPGDILLLWVRKSTKPCHLAIRTDYGMLHAFAGAERVVEHGIDEWWSERILQAYRFRGLE